MDAYDESGILGEKPVLPEGTLLIRLSTPLCYAALPRTVQAISEFSTFPRAVLLWARYPLNKSDASVIDFAVNALKSLRIRSIVICGQYASICDVLSRSGIKPSVDIVRTLDEGLRLLEASA